MLRFALIPYHTIDQMAIIGFYLSRSSCQLAWHEYGQFKDQAYSLQAGETNDGALV